MGADLLHHRHLVVMITAVMPMRRLMSWIASEDAAGGGRVQGGGGLVAQQHLGLEARARAMAMRCFCPPESWAG